jgi:hypothetical protein
VSAVPSKIQHTSSIKEMVKVAKTTIENIGERKEISNEALERFVDVYLRMIKKNELKLNQN